jgi:hypothetical protein
VKNWTRTTFSPFVVIFALVSVRILVKNVKVTVIDFDVHVSTEPESTGSISPMILLSFYHFDD